MMHCASLNLYRVGMHCAHSFCLSVTQPSMKCVKDALGVCQHTVHTAKPCFLFDKGPSQAGATAVLPLLPFCMSMLVPVLP